MKLLPQLKEILKVTLDTTVNYEKNIKSEIGFLKEDHRIIDNKLAEGGAGNEIKLYCGALSLKFEKL